MISAETQVHTAESFRFFASCKPKYKLIKTGTAGQFEKGNKEIEERVWRWDRTWQDDRETSRDIHTDKYSHTYPEPLSGYGRLHSLILAAGEM